VHRGTDELAVEANEEEDEPVPEVEDSRGRSELVPAVVDDRALTEESPLAGKRE
jgi:hypothetical protein